MWKLTIEDDEGTKTLLPLVRDEYLLGRDEKNTIRLTERNISRRHAVLKKNGGGSWQVVDGDGAKPSYNGVYVNGQRVAGAAKLSHADLIQIGDYRIFISDDALLIDESAPTTAVRGSSPPTSPSIALSAVEKPDRLIQIVGPEPGKEFSFEGLPLITIGRAEDCTVSINHPSVSRVHCEIKPLGAGRYEIFDRGSSNGVRVNGTELRRALLEGGDLIELGDVKLRFFEKGQIPRTADVSQQIELSTSRSAPSVRPGAFKKSNGAGIVIGAAVVAAMLAIGAFVLLGGGGESGKAAATPPTQIDPGQKILADAKAARAAGDYNSAVALLGQIPDGSPSKKDPAVAQIWGDWADFLIRQGQDNSQAVSDRRDALRKVASNTNVDGERRTKASDLLSSIDSGATAPTKSVAAVQPTNTPASAPPTAAQPTPDRTAVAVTSPTPTAPSTPDPTPSPSKPDKHAKSPDDTPTKPTSTSAPDVTTTDGETKLRKQLEARAWSGKASPDELKMLKAICKHQGDHACSDRANQLLQQK